MTGPFTRPQAGDVLRIDERASVQFRGERAVVFRVTAVPEWHTYDGWIWLAGYVLDERGTATDRREVFVQLAGLRRLTPPRQPAAPVRMPAADRQAAIRRANTGRRFSLPGGAANVAMAAAPNASARPARGAPDTRRI